MSKAACMNLPEGYQLYKHIDFSKDGQVLRSICIWSITAALAMIVPMLFCHPITAAFDMPPGKIIFCMCAMVAGMAVYLFLPEGVHGIFIRLFTGDSASFGFEIKKGMAYAFTKWFLKKIPYIVVAAAPVVIWGIILAIMLGDVEESTFWYLYAIQIFNVTGAAGDLYVIFEVVRMPEEVMVQDNGTAMDFYLPADFREK